MLDPISPAESGTVTTSFQLLSSLSESGSSTILSIKLNSQPNADVIISFTIPDPTELALNKAYLTFSPKNWDQPQTITLLGVDDYLFDGDIFSYSWLPTKNMWADVMTKEIKIPLALEDVITKNVMDLPQPLVNEVKALGSEIRMTNIRNRK